MPRTETVKRVLHQFGELSDKAKARAIEDRRQLESEDFDHTYVYEDFTTIAGILGIELSTRKTGNGHGKEWREPCIYFSGFSSQGDGACFEGRYTYGAKSCRKIREHASEDKELHRIADELYGVQRTHFYKLYANITHSDHYCHSRSVSIDVDTDQDGATVTDETRETVSQALRDLMDWLYKQLQAEYDWRTGDEAITEYLTDSDDEYTEDGERA